MTNRRHFFATAAGAAAFARIPELFAADTKFDLIIKGGRVIDPSRKFDAVRDVAIAQGKIAAIRENIAAAGAETLDAKGKLVVPGLIDIHTHALRFKDGPSRCLADGVTGIIEAGSKGADAIDELVTAAKAAQQQARILINIGRQVLLPEGDTMDLNRADVGLAKAAIEHNREYVVGIKARLSESVAGKNDYEVLRRATELASSFRIPVMIHMGQTVSPLSKLLPLMKSGDIVTHMYAPPPNSIVDDEGRIRPEVIAARKRGVFFDLGNGRNSHLRWDMADKIMKTGFMPDSFSTDWTVDGLPQVVDLPNVASKFLMLGMPLNQVIACMTSNPSKMFPVFKDRGTLRVGAAADVAVLELREGSFDFLDNYEGKRTGKLRLFPIATVYGGKVVSKRT